MASYIPYYVNFRFNNRPDTMYIISSCTLYWSVWVLYLISYFAEVFCVMYLGGELKIFRRIKDSFFLIFFVLCLLQMRCPQILTISLQINFYHINFI